MSQRSRDLSKVTQPVPKVLGSQTTSLSETLELVGLVTKFQGELAR